MARRVNKLTTLVLVLAVLASAYAQAPSDTGNQPAGTPTTAAPVPTTTTPTPTTTSPTPTTTTKTPTTATGSIDDGSGSSTTPTPTTTAPTPTKTTKAPTTTATTPAPSVTTATPVPAVTTVAPEILVDRTVKSEYGTRAPAANEPSTSTSSSSTASKMGSWLVPAVIGAVVVAALIIMTFFVRSRRGDAAEDYSTPRRGSDNFLEHPKTNAHHVAVPVLEDQAKGKVATEQATYKTVPVGGALHSPRANRVASSPPMLSEVNRPGSPGFGTYKPKNVEGSSVGL